MSFNPDFEKFFLSGVGTGCWLSLVTVTTVGYGDVTPKTIIGRILCVIWMIFGIIFASVLTASVTDTVSGTSSLDINKKTIAVLSNSPEVEIAIKDYHADVVYAKTVEELSNIVRSRKAFAGLLNADIASHNQEVIRNERPSSFHKDVLIFAYTIPIKVTVYALVPKNQRIHNHLECMAKHEEEVLDSTDNRFKRKIQTEILRSLSVYSMFKNHAVISYVTIAIGGVFALGCIYEVLYKIKNKKNFQS
ncbi:uncharacterized protein LOC130613726 [Hydractinia symbiolongicarpus]|uniref:uncharacterized protein LOC130613726 n=1 Tax=Hydractinia symbiolongicarpus TaxID=13093 RepID=UPI0025509C96|nr:uncharacterized protein LOC130613726 [Hydractinia symbiolongicarpus]